VLLHNPKKGGYTGAGGLTDRADGAKKT
jgi:hypothetical protein